MKLLGISGPAGSGKDTAADWLVSHHGWAKVSLADPLKRFCQEVYDFTDDQLWGPSSSRNRPDKRYIREVHARHDWNQEAAAWVCTRCGSGADENPEQCTVYLTPRYALQILGTEWGRKCFPNTWINKAIRTAHTLLTDPGRGKLVTYHYKHDIRFWEKGDPRAGTTKNPTGVAISDVRFKNEVVGIRGEEGQLWRVKPPEAQIGTEAWRAHLSETEQSEIGDEEFHQILVNTKVAFEVLYKTVDEALAVSFPS